MTSASPERECPHCRSVEFQELPGELTGPEGTHGLLECLHCGTLFLFLRSGPGDDQREIKPR